MQWSPWIASPQEQGVPIQFQVFLWLFSVQKKRSSESKEEQNNDVLPPQDFSLLQTAMSCDQTVKENNKRERVGERGSISRNVMW